MEKWNTLKDNPHYKEDLVIAFVVLFCTLYFFLSSNKYCLKARFQKIFFKVIELSVGDKFDKRLLSFVCIWFFYGLFLYIFYNNMQGTLVYSTTFATYFQLPLSVSFMAFSVAFFVAFGDYKFKWLSGFFPIGVPASVAMALLMIEFLSFCMSLLSLAARLFINMLAGHLLLKMFAHYVYVVTMFLWFGYFEGTFVMYILSFLFCYLEYLAGFLQAAVLSSLVAIYINDCSKFAQNN